MLKQAKDAGEAAAAITIHYETPKNKEAVALDRGKLARGMVGRGMGDIHLEAQHGGQIRSIVDNDGSPLFKDPAEFVQFVTSNHNEIRQSP